MLLPFDTTFSYWAMAVPQFEWQADPAAGAQPAAPGATGEAWADATAGVAPAAVAGNLGCEDAGGDAGHPVCGPQLRLVMTGMQWVVVPYWSPRENPYWNMLADDAQDTDRQRNETSLRQSTRPGHHAAPADPEATGGTPQ